MDPINSMGTAAEHKRLVVMMIGPFKLLLNPVFQVLAIQLAHLTA